MSVLLILVFLGFSSHACGVRTLGVAVVDHHSISKESDAKLNPQSRVSKIPNDVTRDDDRRVENGWDDEVKAKTEMEWRVPHRKKGERDPGFNLDYLPPKTHPPVHN